MSLPPPRGFPTSPLSYSRIEQLALHVRSVLGVNVGDRMRGMGTFERLDRLKVKVGGRVVPLSYGCNEVPGGEALTLFDPERNEIVICLSPATYADLERDRPRARFTLFHEIGHAVTHPTLLLDHALRHVAPAFARGGLPTHPHYRDTEWQADALSAALLMPAAGVRKLAASLVGRPLTAHDVSLHFGASELSAKYRLEVITKYNVP